MVRQVLPAAIPIILLFAVRQTCRADQATLDETGNIERDVRILTDKTVNATIEEGHSLLLVRKADSQLPLHTPLPSNIRYFVNFWGLICKTVCLYCRRYTLRGAATARWWSFFEALSTDWESGVWLVLPLPCPPSQCC